MSTALQTGALVCTVLALLSAALVLVAARDPRVAIAVLLELLLAAGLLRLADDPGWRQIVTAAAIVALRRLLSFDLRHAATG